LCHDPRDFLDRPGGAIDVRAAQLGRQQVPPAEEEVAGFIETVFRPR
jgi:hypothetical protein